MSDNSQNNKRHESDLTRKERRAQVRANFLSTHGKKRLEFIWMYYKIEMFIAAIIIFMGILGLQALMQLRYKDMLYAVIVNSDNCDSESLMEDFRDYIGDDNKYHTYQSEPVYIGNTEDGETDLAMTLRLTAFTSEDICDVIIGDEFTLETYESNENFMRMDEYLTQNGIDVDESQIKNNVGIDLSDSPKAELYNFSTADGLYIMINSNSSNMDVVNEFVEFLLEE